MLKNNTVTYASLPESKLSTSKTCETCSLRDMRVFDGSDFDDDNDDDHTNDDKDHDVLPDFCRPPLMMLSHLCRGPSLCRGPENQWA